MKFFRSRALIIVGITGLVVVLLDQLIKLWVISNMAGRPPVVLIEGFLRLRYTRNTGAAFGIFQGGSALLSVAAVVIVGVILFSASRMDGANRWSILALGLIVGGALGNLVDRLRLGSVTDFIEVYGPSIRLGDSIYTFPVFNTADSAITEGVILLIATMLFGSQPDSTAATVRTEPPETATANQSSEQKLSS